jgi:Domain of unknown function (DUF1963)
MAEPEFELEPENDQVTGRCECCDLPDPSSGFVQDILTDSEQVALYSAARDAARCHGIPRELQAECGFGKLLGWPSLVQQDDLDALRDADAGLRLLLQIDPYSNGEELEGWGPGGSLYFLIRDRDLHRRRFGACEFEIGSPERAQPHGSRDHHDIKPPPR